MSYLQQEGISRRTWYAIIMVAILHVGLGYALVTGLAVKAVKIIVGPLETVNIEDEAPPPDEPPPPPPKLEDIPPYVPPPDVVIESSAPPPPTISAQTTISTPEPPRVAPPAPPAPPPPAPVGPDKAATPRGNSVGVSTDDYPEASRRASEEGRTVVRVVIGTDGRVKECDVVQSSGHSRLDERACQVALRRWRFNPAQSAGQPVESTKTQPIQWRLEQGR